MKLIYFGHRRIKISLLQLNLVTHKRSMSGNLRDCANPLPNPPCLYLLLLLLLAVCCSLSKRHKKFH